MFRNKVQVYKRTALRDRVGPDSFLRYDRYDIKSKVVR